MKTINLATGNHPIYENLAKFPPSGFNYVGQASQEEFEKLSVYSKKTKFMKKIAEKIITTLGIPRMMYFREESDLIHSARGVLPLNKKPWVIDIEYVASFTGMHYDALKKAKKRVEKRLSSEHCKYILPHCKAAERSVHSFFGDKWKDKTQTLYPAVEWEEVDRTDKNDFTLLFIGNVFDKKGGLEVLKAFSDLEKNYDISLIMKSPVPENVRKKYNSEKINYIDKRLTREGINDLYRKSDAFIMPTHLDTFGYVFLEAMGFGLPLLGNDIFTTPEIIEDGENGFLLNTKYDWALENGLPNPDFTYEKALSKDNSAHITKQIKEKVSVLIEDEKLRKKMSRNSLNLAKNGKFSIKYRNKKLKKIYENSLK